jgi:type III restriction enzyme
MQDHYWEKSSGQEVKVLKGWMALKECPYTAEQGSESLHFRTPPKNKSEIRRHVYSGFTKCLYPFQKFDSDAERIFATILEGPNGADKWFKPASGQFQLYWRIGSQADRSYEPDFVAETADRKYLVEVKADNEMTDPEVLAKAEAGRVFCTQATGRTASAGGKPWSYMLVPESSVASNMTLPGLASKFRLE